MTQDRCHSACRAMAVPEKIPTGITRQGDLGEQPITTWLLASLWAFKRQGIKPST